MGPTKSTRIVRALGQLAQFFGSKVLRSEILWILVLVFSSALSLRLSLLFGRAGKAPLYDDVVYAASGQMIALETEQFGFFGALQNWASGRPHAPLHELVSGAVHFLDLDFSAGLYLANAIMGTALAFVVASLFSQSRVAALALASLFMVSPAGFLVVEEFRPDALFILVACLSMGIQPLERKTSRSVHSAKLAIGVALSLLFIKPSWTVFTVAVLAVVATQYWIGRSMKPRRMANELPISFLVSVTIVAVVWYFWIGKTSFFDYVFAAVNAEYRVSNSGIEALSGSLIGIWTTFLSLGAPILFVSLVGLAALGILAVRLGSVATNVSRRQLLQMLPVSLAPVMGALATFISQHPSRFQGMFISYTLGFFVLLVAYVVVKRGPTFSKANLHLAIPLLFLPWFWLASSPIVSNFPSYLDTPDSVPETIAREITHDYEAMCSTESQGLAPKVLALPIEDVAPENILYFLRGKFGVTDASLIAVDPLWKVPSEVIEASKEADYLVVRNLDYPANRFPSNMLHDEVNDFFGSMSEPIAEIVGDSDLSYLVYRMVEVCG